ncbi:MAG: hypothetical protein EZS28_014897 [Streblomastix strix]|uniref:Uncharacterized protein n=1 Tax=Streblomastix strix TaxID=222440 RepID=A0A5J4W3X1_9EUKA|nr:MAG: hypothetical protein EZS28_014897 [Streblomastix strix]
MTSKPSRGGEQIEIKIVEYGTDFEQEQKTDERRKSPVHSSKSRRSASQSVSVSNVQSNNDKDNQRFQCFGSVHISNIKKQISSQNIWTKQIQTSSIDSRIKYSSKFGHGVDPADIEILVNNSIPLHDDMTMQTIKATFFDSESSVILQYRLRP